MVVESRLELLDESCRLELDAVEMADDCCDIELCVDSALLVVEACVTTNWNESW